MHPKILLTCIALLGAHCAAAIAQTPNSPPPTKTDNVTETLHGVTITDPYRWLEDQNSPQTRAWIDSENQYTQSVISTLPGRDQIHQQVEKLLKVDTISPPSE
jgi:prolyl oligopeptidase